MPTSASVLIPRFRYYSRTVTITVSSNDQIAFLETVGVTLTATITPGTYTWSQLAYQIKLALEAAGDSTYTVRYRYSNRTFTLTSSGTGGGGVFRLDVGGTARDLLPELGFTSDTSGALSYTSDTQVPSATTVTFTQNLRQPQVRRSIDREDLTLENGRTEIVSFGGVDTYTFQVEHETPAVAQAWLDLWEQAVEHGGTIEFYPDSTDTTNYVEVLVDETVLDLREMTAEGLYRLYAWTVALRVAVPNGGTLDLRALVDRRPSS